MEREKARVRRLASHAKKKGILVQQPCRHCGAADSQMHHPDYEKPLLVEWLCRPCHLALHQPT